MPVNLHLTKNETAEVRKILVSLLPPNTKVEVFGSRAGGAIKPWSDLDLAIDAGRPLSLAERADLTEAFDESSLAWKVDIVDRATVSERFGAIIDRTAAPFDLA